ncbi:sirohydrochlorin chelatase [Tepidiphilus margaritifer]|uniref:sirohydrochlorin chelatase n=1 Tax=Tepidiphilus margaritifer TaxID=203471 RepID=UPI0004097F42|nr:CbiX/SirB N-terminal domain-containing protein [Tepidiphilus margaritifer]
MNTTPAVILFAHGARDPQWAEPVLAVAQQLRQSLPGAFVQPAFLEFLPPGLPEAVEVALARGHRRVVLVPVFIAVGGHLREDLPRLVDSVRAAHPDVSIEVLPALGATESVRRAMADTVLEWVVGGV